MRTRIVVEGMDELLATFRRLGGREMTQRLGQVHKRVGEIVIARAGGPNTGVGEGTGASIRPSASTREVQLRVGGAHRARGSREQTRQRQWGVRQVWPAPFRVHLIGAATDAEDQILGAYLDGVRAVAAPLRIEAR